MNGAGRRRWDLVDSSLVRTDAQSCAQVESPRARVPYVPRCEFPPATVLRADSQPKYLKRFRAAYGIPPVKSHRHPYLLGVQHADEPEPPMILPAARSRWNCAALSNVRTHAQSLAHHEFNLGAHTLYTDLGLAIDDNPVRGSAHYAAHSNPKRIPKQSADNSHLLLRAYIADYEAPRESQQST